MCENRGLVTFIGDDLVGLVFTADLESVRIWKGVGREDGLDQKIEGQVAGDVLKNKQYDLIDQYCHDYEDKTHVVVHGNRWC